jgi:hypothetical protein
VGNQVAADEAGGAGDEALHARAPFYARAGRIA